MSARTAVRGRRRAHAGRISYSRECLSRLARILVRCGHSPNDLVSELRAICRTFKEPSRDWDPTQLGFLADLPHVIALWHSDPSYLDPRGKPAALPLRGRGPTLKSLIGRVLPDEDLKSVTQALVRMRGLRVRAGRYLPTGRHLSYRQESGRLYSLNALLRMLRTVERNVAGRKNAAIFERSAINPNFPVEALPAFHRRVEARALEFLWDIDGDMRRREGRASFGRRTRVGVEVFAFEEPAGERTATAQRQVARRRVHGRSPRRGGERRKP